VTVSGHVVAGRRPRSVRGGVADLPDTVTRQARRTAARTAPSGVSVTDRLGLVGLVNTDSPGLMPPGRDADPPEPRLLRRSAVETRSQVRADR
jgi:hypothetical protein